MNTGRVRNRGVGVRHRALGGLPRISGVVTAVVVAGVLAGCSSSTTTGTTSSAPDTTQTTVATTEAPEPTAAPTSEMPETTAAETTIPSVPGVQIWDEIGPPNAPADHTDPVPPGTLVDGFYWANLIGGSAEAPYVTVLQAFFGEECPTAAAEDGEECYGDVYVRATSTLDVDDVPFAADALITVVDPNVMQNYRIDAAELDLLRTQGSSDAAPEGFLFVPFPWLMAVQGGEIVAFQQLWVP